VTAFAVPNCIEVILYVSQTPEVIRKRHALYECFWSRPSSVYHPGDADDLHIDVHVFRPTWRLWAPARSYFVYITGGLSDAVLATHEDSARECRLELTTFASCAPGFGDYHSDAPAHWLMRLARTAAKNSFAFTPGDTFDCGQPLTPGSEMTGFYFAHPMFVNRSKLLAATVEADTVAHVIPISAAECRLAADQGAVALIEALAAKAVEPLFDTSRHSCL